MDWSAVGALAEAVGAAAVVLSLLYLVSQVRQNNDLLRSGSRQALVTNDVVSLRAGQELADVFAKLVSGTQLSAEDQLRMSFMYALDLRNREFEYFQYKNGLLDEETWLAYRHVVSINHSTGLGRKWWEEIGQGLVDPEFAALVDSLLADAEPDHTYQRMATWADNSGELAGAAE